MSFITFFFLAFIPHSTSITFNFTKFPANHIQEIILSGDASYETSNGEILVTNGKNSTVPGWKYLAGRAAYIKPLHLWDKDSTDLATFSTSFTFMINMSYNYGDGLTFFLAKNNSVINAGANIGLPFDVDTNTSIDPFVAVEFDTYGSNLCDPIFNGSYIGEHVGININSMSSIVYRKWYTDIPNGQECRALIEYDSRSKVLSVGFTSFNSSSVPSWETGLNYTVDLRLVLPEWVIFGFTAATGFNYEANVLKSWAFNSTQLKGDVNVGNETSPSPNTNQNGKNKKGLLVGVIVGSVLILLLLSLLICFCYRKKYKNKRDKSEGTVRRFAYQELATSSQMFVEKLAPDGSGAFYKGVLKDSNEHVAIKRVCNTSDDSVKHYSSEVKIISESKHPNLVPLIGWCHEKKELLLVYKLFEKGSLDLHLFKRENFLTWNARLRIAHGLASAVVCLHEELDVLHRDIKSSNVMLDSNFNAKLGDFGFDKLVNHDTNMVAGTIGYIAPEYLATRKASKESDVFSFGVVALEIASGRSAIDIHSEETNLVKWVWDHFGTQKLQEAADSRLDSKFEEEEMTRLMIVGLWCAHPDPKSRPSIRQAFQVLNSEAFLPTLPLNMPICDLF